VGIHYNIKCHRYHMYLRSSCDNHVDNVIGKLKHKYNEGLSCSAREHIVLWKFKWGLMEGFTGSYITYQAFFTYISKQMIYVNSVKTSTHAHTHTRTHNGCSILVVKRNILIFKCNNKSRAILFIFFLSNWGR